MGAEKEDKEEGNLKTVSDCCIVKRSLMDTDDAEIGTPMWRFVINDMIPRYYEECHPLS